MPENPFDLDDDASRAIAYLAAEFDLSQVEVPSYLVDGLLWFKEMLWMQYRYEKRGTK